MAEWSSHALQTRGLWFGHIFRRLVHVLFMGSVPFLYYALNPPTIYLVGALFLTIFLEVLRLRLHWVCFGQREYEKNHIASFAWGIGGMVVLLLWSPAPGYAVAIALSCALGDPLLGELRTHMCNRWGPVVLGLLLVSTIWYLCAHFFGFGYGWIILAPLIVLVETIEIRGIDDNALMLCIPLIPLWILKLYNH